MIKEVRYPVYFPLMFLSLTRSSTQAVLHERKEDGKELNDIAKRIRTLFFFATPHQNADSSELHKKIILCLAPPQFANASRELGQLQEINKDFADLQNEIRLHSFYESLATQMGEFSGLVLEQAYATIGKSTKAIASVHRVSSD